MATDKIFNGTINYLKIVSSISAAGSFMMLFTGGFDPSRSLDSLIWSDLYGTTDLPDAAKPAFSLAFLVFCWLSVLTFIMFYYIVKFPLARKEKWAYGCLVLVGVGWQLGAAAITLYTKAWSYFLSVGLMTVLFLPPVLLLFPYFRDKKTIIIQ
jgi:hypothetical protein